MASATASATARGEGTGDPRVRRPRPPASPPSSARPRRSPARRSRAAGSPGRSPSKLVCAVEGSGGCGEAAAELAARPRRSSAPTAPSSRRCSRERAADDLASRTTTSSRSRSTTASAASAPAPTRSCHGSLEHTQTGLEPTVFTHVVDCRDPAAAPRRLRLLRRAGRATSTSSTGSTTRRAGPAPIGAGASTRDDWESYQVRIAPDGRSTPAPAPTTATTAAAAASAASAATSARSPKPAWDDDRRRAPRRRRQPRRDVAGAGRRQPPDRARPTCA